MLPEQLLQRVEAGWGSGFEPVRQLAHATTASVLLVERSGRKFVAKTAEPSDASSAWEADLLETLHHNGMVVPLLERTLGGRFVHDSTVLMTYIEGRAPATEHDWELARAYLDKLHASTKNWLPRPDMPSVAHLAQSSATLGRGIDFDTERLFRAALQALEDSSTSVIHGDPNAHNVVLTHDGPALIDWEESRVDYTVLDEAGLPGGEALVDAYPASLAWEAYLFWESQPEYARRCVAKLERLLPQR